MLADALSLVFEREIICESMNIQPLESLAVNTDKIGLRGLLRNAVRLNTLLIMICNAIGFGFIAYYTEGWLHFGVAAVFFLVLLIVSLVDLRTYMIPDSLLITGILLGAPLLFWSQGLAGVIGAALGVLTGGGILLLIVIITKGGMGGGDVKLAAFMGAFLGFQGTLTAFFIAFITGGLYGVFLIMLRKKQKGDEIPFGPFLAFGGMVAMLASQSLFQWYLSLLAG